MSKTETLPEIPGLMRSYRGRLQDMDVSVTQADGGRWHVSLAVPEAFHDGDDYEGYYGTEHGALSAVREFSETGRVPAGMRRCGWNGIEDALNEEAERQAEAEGIIPDAEMDYKEWLEWTGKDESFVGSPVNCVPGTIDLWEASNRIVQRRQQDAAPTP